METVQVELKCKKCGSMFTVKKLCYTMLDAEIEEKRILKRRNPVCPQCFKSEQFQEAIQDAAKRGLPELIGFSDKQIRYAFSLRKQYMERNPNKMQRAKAELDAIRQENIEPVAKARGYQDAEECVADAFKRMNLFEAYLCLTEPNAHRLILLLKDRT